jgi:hypothetical protein
MKYLLLFPIFFGTVLFVIGQNTGPTPPPVWKTAREAQINDKIREIPTQNAKTYPNSQRPVNKSVKPNNQINLLYRIPNEADLKMLSVNQVLKEKYSAFLNKKNTGLIMLLPDTGCSSDERIVNISADCLKTSVPGSGSSFSFRVKTYRIRRLADLNFKNNAFESGGRLIESAMASLGDKDIELLTLDSEGIKDLVALKPEKDVSLVAKQVEMLQKGVIINNILFSNKISAEKNSTYILRSIAFDAKYFTTLNGYTYNELDYDKRRDIIIAFRVVEKNADGSIVLLWKELRNEKSPKLKL